MAALSTTMALITLATGIAGLQWSPTALENNAVVYACATENLSLPWSLTTAPGDSIIDISWFVSGMSEDMIATVSRGNFYAMPDFTNRARQLTNAGIELDDLGVSESGNYSVEVFGRSATGTVITLKRAATVHISGIHDMFWPFLEVHSQGLRVTQTIADDKECQEESAAAKDGHQTTDGELHISQQPEAEYDVATDQYHVVLSCGTFTYPTYPAFEVTWEAPSGHRRNSSRFNNGSFHLRLGNPVQGGVYTCRLPSVSSCGHGNGSEQSVSAGVDKTEARLLLMEARQAALDTKNADLVSHNDALQAALQGLQSRVRVLDEENQPSKAQEGDLQNNTNALESPLQFLGQGSQSDLLNRTDTLENIVRVLGEENQLLKAQQGDLQNNTNALESRLQLLGEENQLLKVQQGELQTNTSAVQSRLQFLGEENQLLKAQQGELQNNTGAVQNRLQFLGDKNQILNGGELLNNTSALESRLQFLGEENQILKVQQDELQNNTSALESRLQFLGEENQILKVQQGELQNNTSALESRLQFLGEENQILKVQQDELQNNTSALESRLQLLGEENQLLKVQQGELQNNTGAVQNRLQFLGEENQLLKVQQGEHQKNTIALESRLQFLGEENQVLKVQQGELQTNTSAVQSRLQFLGEENQVLKVQQGELQKNTNALKGLRTQTVSFHAELDQNADMTGTTHLVLPRVFRNHGDGYDNATGIFTAPYNGTYCFLATAGYTDSAAPAGGIVLYLGVNFVVPAYIRQPTASGQDSASLHAVVALQAGHTARLMNNHNSAHYLAYATSFSGFLVDHTTN